MCSLYIPKNCKLWFFFDKNYYKMVYKPNNTVKNFSVIQWENSYYGHKYVVYEIPCDGNNIDKQEYRDISRI